MEFEIRVAVTKRSGLAGKTGLDQTFEVEYQIHRKLIFDGIGDPPSCANRTGLAGKTGPDQTFGSGVPNPSKINFRWNWRSA